MIKMRLFFLIVLFFLPGYFVSEVSAQNKDCDAISEKFNEAKNTFEADRKEYKKAFGNWDKYYKELHSISYEATDEPLVDTVKKCESGEYDSKDLCKGATQKFEEISPKEKSAKVELDSARTKADKSKKELYTLAKEASKMGCDLKM